MIIDSLSSMLPGSEGFAAAEATLARLRGYLEHFADSEIPDARSTRNIEETLGKVDTVREDARGRIPSEAEFIAMLNESSCDLAGVYTEKYETRLGVKTSSNEEVAAFVAKYPDRTFGFGGIDPWDDDAPEQVERGVREFGLKGFVISPFKQGLSPYDPRMARVFAMCEQLGVAALLHSGINWWFEADYDLGHPKYIDRLANAFPKLKIVALHCGWPWVLDMMMVTWRHPNVYVDLSAHRPRHLLIEGSGWAPLMQYGNRMLADRVIFASTWTLTGIPPQTLIQEIQELPLKEGVAEKWLGHNAMKAFNLA